jgi:hypothetical protein
MSPLRKRMAIALSACVLAGSFASVASANPSPPTNGGNEPPRVRWRRWLLG